MANDPRRRQPKPEPVQNGEPLRGFAPPREPEVRRWPHPVSAGLPPTPDATANYIRCALSYQNQLLAEIQVLLMQENQLLEQLVRDGEEDGGETK